MQEMRHGLNACSAPPAVSARGLRVASKGGMVRLGFLNPGGCALPGDGNKLVKVGELDPGSAV